jgi:hypothetical protein
MEWLSHEVIKKKKKKVAKAGSLAPLKLTAHAIQVI